MKQRFYYKSTSSKRSIINKCVHDSIRQDMDHNCTREATPTRFFQPDPHQEYNEASGSNHYPGWSESGIHKIDF